MDHLTQIEHETLEILKQLDHCCEAAEINDTYTEKGLVVIFGDINFSVFKYAKEGFPTVAKYLQKNGLDFSLTFDVENEDPGEYVQAGKYPETAFVPLGILKDRTLGSLRIKIEELIHKLRSKNEETILNNGNGAKIVTTLVEKGVGYLILRGEKIPIGGPSTSKFRLADLLCSNGFHKARTIDSVFEYIKVTKDKNKTDAMLISPLQGVMAKLIKINTQIREINRMIRLQVKKQKIKKFNFCLKLEKENKNVWIEEGVARSG